MANDATTSDDSFTPLNTSQNTKTPQNTSDDWVRYQPETVNPDPDDLSIQAADPDRDITAILAKYTAIPNDLPQYTLEETLQIAISKSREYRTAQEEYFLAALRLLDERHRFGPQFFNETSLSFNADASDGDFDIALGLVNEFRVSQQLRSGGEIAARAIVSATEHLRQTVSDSTAQSASLILSANLPLLRGAGDVAQESLISAERDMIYAARTFERFRRQYLFDISTQYFDLVLSARTINNAEIVHEHRSELLLETQALVKAGRKADFEVNEAEQRVLQGEAGLASQRESYILSLERFRSRLGLQPNALFLVKDELQLDLAIPDLNMAESVIKGLRYRLDLQTTRDQLDDTKRAVANSRNNLLPDLNLNASITAVTNPDLNRAGLQFDAEETDFATSVTFGLPLDRESERINLRRSLISQERSIRRLQEAEDNVALDIRRAIRAIELAMFSLQLQERTITLVERRKEGLDARRDQVTTRAIIDAEDELSDALQSRERQLRNVRVATLQYLLDTGQLRVDQQGRLLIPTELTTQTNEHSDRK